MNPGNLNPQEQALFFELSKKAGQQPTSGGMDQSVPDPDAQMEMPAPGSFKDNPQGAMEAISKLMMSKATGQQLNERNGQLSARVPVDQPLLRALGLKKNVPVGPNYADPAQKAGLSEFLPQGLPRLPNGQPFVSATVSDQAKQLAAGRGDVVSDPAIGEFGSAFLAEAGTPEQKAAWDKLRPETQAKLAKIVPGYRTERQDAFSQSEVLSNGDVVQKNIKNGKYFYAGTQIPYTGEITGQFLPKTQKNMSDSTAIQLGKTQTLMNSIDLASQNLMPEKFGLWQGSFNKTIGSYTNKDPQAAEMFRQLKTVFTEVTHDLYGGTLTGNELDQATDLLFNQYQSFEAVQAALGVQKAKLGNRLENISGLLKAGNVRGADVAKPNKPTYGNKEPAKKKSLGDIFGKK